MRGPVGLFACRFCACTALILASVTASADSALVTMEPTTASADSDVTLAFSVKDGCHDQPPSTVAVEFPEGVIGVRPHPMNGWRLTVEEGAFAYVYPHRGGIISSGVLRALWTHDIGDDVTRAEPAITVTLTARLTDFPIGATVAFPTTITCPEGGLAPVSAPALTIEAPPRRRY